MLISVDDSGAGIAADKSWTAFSSAAFPPRARAEAPVCHSSKETVDAFHGTIRVESEPESAAPFIITVAESANGQQWRESDVHNGYY